jgi:hypothetical protein
MRTMIVSSALAAAALLAAPAIATAQTPMGDAPFCLKSAAGSTSCVYRTMAACEQSKLPGSSDQCLDRAQVGGTTGLSPGGVSPAPSPSPSPAPQR